MRCSFVAAPPSLSSVFPAYPSNRLLFHTVTQTLYSKRSISAPHSETLSFNPPTSPHHHYPPPYPDRHHLRYQPPTLSSLAAKPSEERSRQTSHPLPLPQPSSFPQRPRPSSPLSVPSMCSFPGILLIRAPLHHVHSSTSFVMGMNTSAASCTKTRTSFSTTFSIRSSRRYSTTTIINIRTRTRTLLPTPPGRIVSFQVPQYVMY